MAGSGRDRGELLLAHRMVLKNDEPSEGLETIEEYMEKVQSIHIESGEEDAVFFVGETLPSVVYALLRRSDFDEDTEHRVFRFLELVVMFIARTIGTKFETLAVLLSDIWSENNHPFYVHNTSMSVCEDIAADLDHVTEDMYDEPNFVSEAIFAESGQMELSCRGVTSRVVSMINVFGRDSGFRAIKDEIMAQKGPPSLLRLRMLLQPLYEIREFLTTEFVQWFMGIRERVFDKILRLSDEEFKNDYKMAADVVKFVSGLEKLTMKTDANEIVDKFKLDFAVKGFRSPFLERRLWALGEMTDFINMVTTMSNEIDGTLSRDEEDLVWVTPDFMRDWLVHNEVLESLFVHNVHVEVLRRCSQVILFLSSQDYIGEREANMIWEASLGKHESVQKSVLELLSDVVRSLSLDVLQVLVKLIEPLKPSDYSLQHILLLRMLTLQLIEQGGFEGFEFQYDGLQLMWRLCQEDMRFSPPELHSYLVNYFVDAIGNNESKSIRGTYFKQCLQNLKEHRSVPQSLRIMSHLIHSIGPKRKRPEVDWSAFDCLKDEHELLDLVIDDLVHYQNAAYESVAAARPRTADSAINSECTDGVYSRLDQIYCRLSFLTVILELQGTSLTTEQVDVLWETLTRRTTTERQRNVGYKWFEESLFSQYTRDALTSSAEHLFTNLICKDDVSKLSGVGFNLFRFCMKFVNWKRNAFHEQHVEGQKQIIVVKSFELIGMQVLWEIAVGAESDAVAGDACQFVNNLHQSLGEELKHRMGEKREEYIANCMKHMLQAAEMLGQKGSSGSPSSNEKRVCRCIRLLKTFLQDSEDKLRESDPGIQISKHGLRLKGEPILLRIQMTGAAAGVSQHVTLHANHTVFNLRREVAKKFNQHPRMVRLFAHGIEFMDDSKTLSEIRLCKGDIVHVANRPHRISEGDDGTSSSSSSDDAEVISRHEDSEKEMAPSGVMAEDQPSRERAHPETKIPHYTLSRDYFSKLFHLLEGPERVAAQVWELLMQLPTNDSLLEQLHALGDSWESVIGANESIYSLWYCFQIVESLLEEEGAVDEGKGRGHVEEESSEQGDVAMTADWRVRFLERGGLGRLLAVLMSGRFTAPDTSQGFACLWVLLKIIHTLVICKGASSSNGGLSSSFENVAQLESFVHRLMDIFRFAAKSSQGEGNILADSRDTVAGYAMSLLQACAVASSQALSCIYSLPDIHNWATECLVVCTRPNIRCEAARGLIFIAWPKDSTPSRHTQYQVTCDGGGVLHPHCFFLNMLLPILADIPNPCETCGELFELVCNLLGGTKRLCAIFHDAEKFPSPDAVLNVAFAEQLDSVAELLIANLRERTTAECRGCPRGNAVLLGTLQMLRWIFNLRPSLKAKQLTSGYNMVRYLYQDCLFESPAIELHSVQGPPKCKMASTRGAAFMLLIELIHGCPDAYMELLDEMLEIHGQREMRHGLYMYQPSQMDKAACGFVGLRNLGATCYMNSLLQQLFHIPEFRACILKVPVEEDKKHEDLMYQLQLLFGYLQESEKQFFETRSLCQAYTDYDGQPVNTSLQMDVDEFFNVLFDKLETGLTGTPQEELLRDCFGGKMVNQIICKDTVRVGDEVFDAEDRPFKSEREESFYTLQLEVKQKRNILESLDLFIEGEVLEGDNKYFCEQANQKVDAVKRMCISQLPKTLILHLKRFEFDLECMKKLKVNDSCEFPTTLNMYPYTREGIEKRERAAKEAVRLGRDGTAAAAQVESPGDCGYELVGVLVHTGTADSGHYYSYIKDRSKVGKNSEDTTGGWYLFNDMHVEPFDHSEIGAACYGGSDLVQQEGGSGLGQQPQRPVSKCVPRMYNAYMLFYERVGVSRERSSMPARDGKLRAQIPKEIMSSVWGENGQFLRDKLVYESGYFAFVRKVVVMGLDGNQLPSPEAKACVFRLCVQFLMDTVMHSWEMSQVDAWAATIIRFLTRDAGGLERCKWLLSAFVQEVAGPSLDDSTAHIIGCHWLREGLLHCRVASARECVVRILLHAVHVILAMEPQPHPDDVVTVPHCLPAFASSDTADSDIEGLPDVYAEVYRHLPLLTDVPHPRHYPGGFDPSLQPPLDYTPFPRACTAVGLFIDGLLSLLPDLPLHWRHFSQYFSLLAQIAKIGIPEKAFLMSRRAVARCIDIFLHEDSPLCETHKYRFRMGDKVTQPVWDSLVEMVADLVCSAHPLFEVEEGEDSVNEASPMTQDCAGTLDDACIDLVCNRRFIHKVLSEEANPRAAQRLAVHICWSDPKNSSMVITVVCEIIEETNEEDFPFLFEMLSTLVQIRDGQETFRAEKLTVNFLRAVNENVEYPDICVRCIDFLTQLCSHHQHLRTCVAQSIYMSQRRRETNDWFERCIFEAVENVRSATGAAARTLAFPHLLSVSRDASQQTPRNSTPDMITGSILEYLMAHVERLLPLMQQVPVRRDGSAKLVQYFRAMNSIVVAGGGGAFTAVFDRHAEVLVTALTVMNKQRLDMDQNRGELVKLILSISLQYPDILEILSEQSDCIIMHHITVKQIKNHIFFNKFYMPHFYALVLNCCKASQSFREGWMEHCNSIWATEQFCLQSHRYPEVANVLGVIITLCLDSPPPPSLACVRSFRQRILDSVCKALPTSPEGCLFVLARVLDPPFADDIAHVAGIGLVPISTLLQNYLANALAPPLHANAPASNDYIMDVATVMHRIVVDGVRTGVTADVQQGLRVYKQRNELVKLIFRYLGAMRMADAARSTMMELVEYLAKIDKACAIVGVEEISLAYAECELAGNADEEHSTGSELWPEIRGPKGETLHQTNKRFFALAVELAAQALQAAQSSNDMVECAATIRLVMSIAIDALPTTDEEPDGEIGNELLGLLRAITDVEDRDGGGGEAKEKIRAAIKGEGYAGEWVRKLLLHYQGRLLQDGVREVCVGVAREVVSAQWGREDVRELNEGVLAGIVAAIEAPNPAHTSSSNGDAAGRSLSGVLKSILPLHVICRVGSLRNDIKARDEGVDLPRRVRAAVDEMIGIGDDEGLVERVDKVLVDYTARIKEAS